LRIHFDCQGKDGNRSIYFRLGNIPELGGFESVDAQRGIHGLCLVLVFNRLDESLEIVELDLIELRIKVS
jgi:hypothetical protein